MAEAANDWVNLPTAWVWRMLEADKGWRASCRVWVAEYDDEGDDRVAEIIEIAVGSWLDIDFYASQQGCRGDLLAYGFRAIDWRQIAVGLKRRIAEEEGNG